MTETLAVALDTLRANPLRTLLSTIGVVIGVGALLSILALADGLEAFSRNQIESTTDLQMITVAPVTTDQVEGIVLRRRDYAVFEVADATELAQQLKSLAAVGISTDYAAFWGTPGDTARWPALISAGTPASFSILDVQLAAGRFFSDDDVARGRRVAIVSQRVLASLGSGEAALGGTVLIGEIPYTIVGIAAGDAAAEQLARIGVPLVAPSALPGAVDARPPTISVRAARIEDVPRVRDLTSAWLAQRWDTSAVKFTVATNVARVDQARRGMLVFKLTMGAIAFISLLVGGIGIMNVLLASVSERTREIGVRRAIGARQTDIRRQFLTESVAISAAGSVVGAVLGMLMSAIALAVISRITGAGLHAVFAWESALFAITAGLAVGLSFGMYPARRAARLSPVEALRHES